MNGDSPQVIDPFFLERWGANEYDEYDEYADPSHTERGVT